MDDFPKFRVVEQYDDFASDPGKDQLIRWTLGTIFAFAVVSVVMWLVG